jgi:hypothetical protein
MRMDGGSAALVLAAGQAVTPAWLTPVIAGAAAILAATVTALASGYAAKRKVAELRLSNSFELAKQYLESARNYTETVYMPLAISVHELYSGFLAFKAADADHATSAEGQFRTACEKFADAVDHLFVRGAGAVLTLRLDEEVTRFVSFLRESLASTSGKVIKTRIIPSTDTMLRLALKMLKSAPLMVVPFAGMPIMFSTLSDILPEYRSIITAAPISSQNFERQFSEYITTVKSGIKEVTLGAHKDGGGG